jgi:hypothetical protein
MGGGFELYRGLPVKGGMAPAAVVEALDLFEDRAGVLQAGVPALPAGQFGLHPAPEGFGDGVVLGVADAAQRRQ